MAKIVTYKNLELNGRLGNQLWQIAWQFGEAARLHGVPVIKKDWSYRKFFSVPNKFYEYPLIEGGVFDGGTEYFQELPYFDAVAADIYDYFQPRDGVPDNSGFCSIHVRRGDYLNNPHLFPPCTAAYYNAAVEDVISRKPDMKFMVFSDDIEWCKSHQGYLGLIGQDAMFVDPIVTPVEVVDRTEPGDQDDLFAMMGCEEHILSNSTFAWWGAWLSLSHKIQYPSVWFGPEVPGYATHKRAFPSDDPRWVEVQV